MQEILRQNLEQPLLLKKDYDAFNNLLDTNVDEYLAAWKAANHNLIAYEAEIDSQYQVSSTPNFCHHGFGLSLHNCFLAETRCRIGRVCIQLHSFKVSLNFLCLQRQQGQSRSDQKYIMLP
jgi:hypothetical protein